MGIRTGLGASPTQSRWWTVVGHSIGGVESQDVHWGAWVRWNDVTQGDFFATWAWTDAGGFSSYYDQWWDAANPDHDIVIDGTTVGTTSVPFVVDTAYYIQVSINDATDEVICSVNGTIEVQNSGTAMTGNPPAVDDFSIGSFYQNNDATDEDCDFTNLLIYNQIKNHSDMYNNVAPWMTPQDTTGLVSQYRFETGNLEVDTEGTDDATLGTGANAPVFITDFGITGEAPATYLPRRRRHPFLTR